jgi:integrase
MNEKLVKLPSIKRDNKLPVVLNHQECKALFLAPELLKHRVLLAFMYSAGLRAGEASRLKLSDIDSGRMMIHIRQSKYNKDRYVPLSPAILIGLRKYYYACRPVDYLFNGNEPGSPLSVRGMQWALREAVKKCKLHKGITLHTLRHTYATHLLEYGMDIITATRRPVLRQLQMEFGIHALSEREKKHWKQICIEHLHFDPDLCPCCKKGKMVTIELILPGRAPPINIFQEIQNNNLYVNF